jgi:hypothetical protein
MHKFKKGDKVKVIAPSLHPRVGQSGVIKDFDKDSDAVIPYIVEFADKKTFWFSDKELSSV